MRRLAAPLISLTLVLVAALSGTVRAEDSLDVAIAQRMVAEGRLVIDGQRLNLPALRAFYERRGFRPAWFAPVISQPDTSQPVAVQPVAVQPDIFQLVAARELLAVITGAEAEGLVSADYHPAAIAERLDPADAERRLDVELLLTDALLTYALDLHQGRLAPRVINREFAIEPATLDAATVGHDALAAIDLKAFLAGLAPRQAAYGSLKKALARYRVLEKAGGWPQLPEGPKLQPGMRAPAIATLRRRLQVTGDLDAKVPVTQVYDSAVSKAVRHFQARHGLEPDGVIGPATRVALNVPVADRIVQILANLERERWMPADLGARYVLVNIAGFTLKGVDQGATVLDMPVIVGTAVRRTPILDSAITSVVFNPMWTVPRKLAREDILPKLQKDPGYLDAQGIKILSDWTAEAKPLSTRGINWKTVGPAFMNRVRLRQEPGEHNALGQVKFNLPNSFDVYLHDTPHREKFGKTVRTFSSGCVRVGNPLALAEFLLRDMPEWTADKRQGVLEAGKTRTVGLATPVPVHILYQTAWMDGHGEVHFREDIYGRDTEIMKAVERPGAASQRVAQKPAQGLAQGQKPAQGPAQRLTVAAD